MTYKVYMSGTVNGHCTLRLNAMEKESLTSKFLFNRCNIFFILVQCTLVSVQCIKRFRSLPLITFKIPWHFSPHVRESRTVLDSGFHAVDSGSRVLDSGFQKELDSIFFSGFNVFLRTSFSCSNLAILKDVVRRHNKFVFFFDLQNY